MSSSLFLIDGPSRVGSILNLLNPSVGGRRRIANVAVVNRGGMDQSRPQPSGDMMIFGIRKSDREDLDRVDLWMETHGVKDPRETSVVRDYDMVKRNGSFEFATHPWAGAKTDKPGFSFSHNNDLFDLAVQFQRNGAINQPLWVMVDQMLNESTALPASLVWNDVRCALFIHELKMIRGGIPGEAYRFEATDSSRNLWHGAISLKDGVGTLTSGAHPRRES